ncbi:MAG: DUF4214 domain-containing protein [Bdellovibrionaceae bacterium]|nr:DUF4214 domain-containing protein [Pseudobdellovibrionaceae bacterium]MBX3034780.1 DUF4214 domain-containing protein [Pseudobdellovibrionaceae bacterium]
MPRTIRLAMSVVVVGLQLVAFLNCSGGMQSLLDAENASLSNLQPQIINNQYRLLGDMLVQVDVYDRWQAGLMDGEVSREFDVQSAHYNIGMKYWPGGIIPVKYDYNEATFTAAESQDFKNKIQMACNAWGQHANIRCVEYNGTQEYYLAAILATYDEMKAGCGTFAGACATYPLGTARRFLYALTTAGAATVLHEFGHALGFVHEHQRPDLDTYYTYPATLPPGVSQAQYNAVKPVSASRPLGEYDPQSIMHYAYNVLKDSSVLLKNEYSSMALVMRTSADMRLSPFDAEGVQRLYGAPTQAAGRACETPSATKFVFPHNTQYAFFESETAVNASCKYQVRTCQNGTLSGGETYRHARCVSVCQTRDGGQFMGTQRVYAAIPGETAYYSLELNCEGSIARIRTDSIRLCTASGQCQATSYLEAGEKITLTNRASDYLSKAPGAQAMSCTFGGQTVNDGSRVTAYRVASVPSGKSCSSESELRQCSNGTLSGSFAYSSCQVEAAPSVMDYLTPQEQKRAKYIIQVYKKALLREPDDRGLIFWSRDYEGYNGCRNVTKAFLTSPEALQVQSKLNNRDFVHYAYDLILIRDSYQDAAGAAFWTGILDRGEASRADVLNEFFKSAELGTLCTQTYGIEP